MDKRPLIVHKVCRRDIGELETRLVEYVNNLPAGRCLHAAIYWTDYIDVVKKIHGRNFGRPRISYQCRAGRCSRYHRSVKHPTPISVQAMLNAYSRLYDASLADKTIFREPIGSCAE